MPLSVATVFAPRPAHPKFRDYLALLALQKRSAEAFRHRHFVVSDRELDGLATVVTKLPDSLNQALLGGMIAAIDAWPGDYPLVLMDADCLVVRSLRSAFDGTFDVGLTNRTNDVAPIQNGVMYFAAGSKAVARAFLSCALELCKEHWGGDQEAIAQAAAPVPAEHGVQERFGVRFSFLSCKTHNWSPKSVPLRIPAGRFVLHLKGDRKDMAPGFARLLSL